MRRLYFGCLLVLYPAAARATDVAAGETLYAEAALLIAEGKTEAACAKLDASYGASLQPKRLLEAADCYASLNKTASAWERYQTARGAAERYGNDEVAALAAERIARIEPQLTLIQLEISDELRKMPGLVIKINQKPIDPNSAVPVDQGTTLIDAEAPDHASFHAELTATERGVQRVRVDMEPRQKPMPAEATTVEPATAAASAPAHSEPPQHQRNVQQTAGYVVGGVGGLALVLGIGFNLKARSQAREANTLCLTGLPASSPCTVLTASDRQAREEQVQAVQSSATTSYVLLGVGAAAVATSGILILTASRGDKSNNAPQLSASFSDRHVALTLGGSL